MVRRLALVPLGGLVLLLSMLVAPHVGPAQAGTRPRQAVEPRASEKQKKNPLAKLGQPWPDAGTLRERRLEAENRPIFASLDPLSFTLAADFKTVNQDRDPESTQRFPAVLTVTGDDGQPHAIPVRVGTRGHLRLRRAVCGFPPLRIEFPKKDEVKGTVFAGQDVLKLGTHCQDSSDYEQYLLREYLAYRIFNLLTPHSFRARLAKAEYVTAGTGKRVATRYALFIEDNDDVARRLEGRLAQLLRVRFSDLDQETLTLTALLEFMVGNTDYSIAALHNVELVQNQARVLFPIHYDFDLSGLVGAAYAIPDRRLGIKSVRDRLYRGPCRSADELQPLLARFRAKKDEVMALGDSVPDLSRSARADVKNYLQQFYRAIDNPGAVKSLLVNQCTKSGVM